MSQKSRQGGFGLALENGAQAITRFVGSTTAFVLAVTVVLVWAITGPLFHFSDTWQLVINTGTTIVTFLMVFLIQRAQNKEALATQLKLNEVVAAIQGASNRLVGAEDLTEQELKTLQRHFKALANMAKEGNGLRTSHSIEEAEARHKSKRKRRRPRVEG